MKKNLSRRDFLKGAATGAVAVATISLTGCGAPASSEKNTVTTFERNVKWDAEYDVVVVGFGAAAAVAAITAAEQGAKTLILEKAPKGDRGGNSRYAAQLILCPSNKEKALTYYKNLRGKFQNQTDEIVNSLVDGLMSSRDWLTKHGAKLADVPLPEYPELEGSDAAVTVLVNGEIWTSSFYKFLTGLVKDNSKSIDIWYATPAKALIQDKSTKVVHGVTVTNGGKDYNVRAKNGVVMACGGFENSDEMLENYCQLADAYGKGARYNTGDGVKMAIDVGAELWHMSTLSGNDVNFVDPDTNIAAGYALTYTTRDTAFTGFGAQNMIIVGGDGTRFTNEGLIPRHGHVDVHGTWFTQLVPMNSYCVFDETARKAVPAYNSWSAGMTEEIKKNWIKKADTIEELAKLINIDPKSLKATVGKYNQFCASGVDADWGRAKEFLKPLSTPPYYAFEVKATMTNTQGGAKRNTACEILDVWGNTIPHLYGAGEFGSFYCDIYNGGGNLSECIFTGVRSGTASAKAKTDISSDSLVASKAVNFTEADTGDEKLGANEYLGVGSGIGGDVKVKCTIENGKITAVKIVSQSETKGIGSKAVDQLPDKFVGLSSTADVSAVDGVTGATVTSTAIKNAVLDCLKQAKII